MCGSRREWWSGSRSRCSSEPRTRRDTRSTNRASTARFSRTRPRRRRVARRPRVTEPPVGEPRRPLVARSGSTSFPSCRQRFPSQLGRRHARAVLPRHQQGPAVAHSRGIGRGHLQPAHHAARRDGDRHAHGRRPASRELPELWNTRMQEYLGVVPDSDAKGILQDIHWSIGAMGYFATYTLGNLISAQLWEAFGRAHRIATNRSARGDFTPLLAWLRTNVHQYGRKYQPQELVERVTGSRIDPEPYLRYLEEQVQRRVRTQADDARCSGLSSKPRLNRALGMDMSLSLSVPPRTTPQWVVSDADAGSRLDKFLAPPDRLGSRSKVGHGARARQDLPERRRRRRRRTPPPRLSAGDVVRLWMDRPGSATRTPGTVLGRATFTSCTKTTPSSSSTSLPGCCRSRSSAGRARRPRTTSSRTTCGRAASGVRWSCIASTSTRPAWSSSRRTRGRRRAEGAVQAPRARPRVLGRRLRPPDSRRKGRGGIDSCGIRRR